MALKVWRGKAAIAGMNLESGVSGDESLLNSLFDIAIAGREASDTGP